MLLDTLIRTGGFRTVHLREGVCLGGDGGVSQFCVSVFVCKVLVTDRAVVMLLDTCFRAGSVFAVHMRKGMACGGEFFVGGVIAAGAGVVGFPALLGTGRGLTFVLLNVMTQSTHICLLFNHIAAYGTDLSFGQAGCRTGGSTGEHLLRMLGGISRNLGEGQRKIVAALGSLNQHIGPGAEIAHNGHIHRLAVGVEGMAAVFFQEVELNACIGEGCLRHAGAAFKEEGAYIGAIHSGSLQTGTPAEHPVAGTDS